MNRDDEQRIPLIAEEAAITKADVVTDRVRVTTTVEERHVLVEDVLEKGALSVERRVVQREVTSLPEPRQEGETLIISVVEERLIVEKRLFVVEEVHITRTSNHERIAEEQTLRTMHATVQRADLPEKGEDNG